MLVSVFNSKKEFLANNVNVMAADVLILCVSNYDVDYIGQISVYKLHAHIVDIILRKLQSLFMATLCSMIPSTNIEHHKTTIKTMARISYYIYIKHWDVVMHPFTNITT